MKLDRRAVESLVPQAGAMCLLDAVTDWDSERITCTAALRLQDHPLAHAGDVPAVVACEYAAQATAVHGALLDRAGSPRAGMLASLVDVQLHCASFPRQPAEVVVHAHLRSRTEGACLYAFDVASAGSAIAEGQLMVAFTPPGAGPA